MHVDAEAVRKSVRTYMMIGAALLVFTGITVAANYLHLPVPAAITLALIIASIKALDGRRRVHAPQPREAVDLRLADPDGRFFIVLMSVPLFTIDGHVRHAPDRPGGRPRSGARRGRTRGSLNVAAGFSSAVHRAVGDPHRLLRRVGGRPVPRSSSDSGYVAAAAVSLAAGAGLAVYGAAFQRKTRQM